MNTQGSGSSQSAQDETNSRDALRALERNHRNHLIFYLSGLATTLAVSMLAVLLLFQVSSPGGFRSIIVGSSDNDERVLSSAQLDVLRRAQQIAQTQLEGAKHTVEVYRQQLVTRRLLKEFLDGDEGQPLTDWVDGDSKRLTYLRTVVSDLLAGNAIRISNFRAPIRFSGPRVFPPNIEGDDSDIFIPGLNPEPFFYSSTQTVEMVIEAPTPGWPEFYWETVDGASVDEIESRLRNVDVDVRQRLVKRLNETAEETARLVGVHSQQVKEDEEYIAQIDGVIGDFGQPSPSAELAGAVANFVVRVGALGLIIFIIQILLSFTRYHARMADHYRSLVSAFKLASGDVSMLLNIAQVIAPNVGIGKVPQSTFEKAMDTVRDLASPDRK